MKIEYVRGYLFVKEGCPYCKKAKKAVLKINNNLYPEKRIMIKDCSNLEDYGIFEDSVIKQLSNKIDGYPMIILIYKIGNTIFYSKKSGANSMVEYYAWLKVKLRDTFIIKQDNEFFPNLNQYAMFDQTCEVKNGRTRCR